MSNDKFVLDTSNVGGKRTLEYKITKAILNSNDQTLTVKNINTKLSSETLDNKTKKLLFCIVANLLLTSISSELRDSIKNVYEIIYTDTNGSSISINRKYCFIGVGETVNLTIRCDALSDIKVRVNNKYTECEGSVGVVTFSVGTDSDSPIQVKNIDIYVGGQLRTTYKVHIITANMDVIYSDIVPDRLTSKIPSNRHDSLFSSVPVFDCNKACGFIMDKCRSYANEEADCFGELELYSIALVTFRWYFVVMRLGETLSLGLAARLQKFYLDLFKALSVHAKCKTSIVEEFL